MLCRVASAVLTLGLVLGDQDVVLDAFYYLGPHGGDYCQSKYYFSTRTYSGECVCQGQGTGASYCETTVVKDGRASLTTWSGSEQYQVTKCHDPNAVSTYATDIGAVDACSKTLDGKDGQ